MRVSPAVFQVSSAAGFLGLMFLFARMPASISFETQAQVIEERSETRFQAEQGPSLWSDRAARSCARTSGYSMRGMPVATSRSLSCIPSKT